MFRKSIKLNKAICISRKGEDSKSSYSPLAAFAYGEDKI